jgi:hypothetical protein
VLAIFFVPLFFVVVLTLTKVKRRSERNMAVTPVREH